MFNVLSAFPIINFNFPGLNSLLFLFFCFCFSHLFDHSIVDPIIVFYIYNFSKNFLSVLVHVFVLVFFEVLLAIDISCLLPWFTLRLVFYSSEARFSSPLRRFYAGLFSLVSYKLAIILSL